MFTLSPRAEWSLRLVASNLLRVPEGEIRVMLRSPLCRCFNVMFICTCSSFFISEAVLEHAEVFADKMRLPESGINLLGDSTVKTQIAEKKLNESEQVVDYAIIFLGFTSASLTEP